MSLTIVEAATPRLLKQFIKFPYSLYKKHPFYVPRIYSDEIKTLSKKFNPAFNHCEARYWLVYKNGRIAGRIAGIINNRHIEKWNQRYVRFGWIDFIDDISVSAALISAVEQWACQRGMTAVHGPLGFTDLDNEGMLVQGFDQLSTLATIYNHPYYPEHMEKLGYTKDTDWVEYEIDVPQEPDPQIHRIADIALRRNKLKVPVLKRKKDLLKFSGELFDVLDETYAHLYGTVPLTSEQVRSYINQYFGFINPDFVPLVTDKDNRLVAFGVVLPSLSLALQKARGRYLPFGFIHLIKALRKNSKADLYLIGVRKAYQGKGVNAIIIDRMNMVFNKLGITRVESNPELETNRQVQEQWKYYTRRNHKRRRIFIKKLESGQA